MEWATQSWRMEIWLDGAAPWLEVLKRGVRVTIELVKGRPRLVATIVLTGLSSVALYRYITLCIILHITLHIILYITLYIILHITLSLLLPGEMNILQTQCKIDFNTFLLHKPLRRCKK